MLTPKQIRIFEIFMRKPYEEFTYKEIKEFSKEKSNSIIQKAISKYLEDDLIIRRKIGNMLVYKIKMENNIVFSYFDILISEKLSNPVKKSVEKIRKELKNTEFISIALFGSYAEMKQTRNSDLDIVIFVTNKDDKRKCELSLKAAQLKTILNLDYHVFTKNEMLSMLQDKHENLGKQIAYNHLAIHNPAIFYSIIQEGIDNGFKIVYS